MTVYDKPLPVIDEHARPFWEACKSHRLVTQRCLNCGHLRWPLGPACTNCLSPEYEWAELAGEGEVYSFIVYHHAFHPAFKDDLPYNVALIRLDEGHTMIANVVGGDVAVGQRVRVEFDDVTDEVAIPRFRPVEGEGG